MSFDNVFLPTLSAEYWLDLSPEHRMNLLLRGITRATKWAYMSGIDGCRIEEGDILRAAAGKRLLRVEKVPSFRSLMVDGLDLENGIWPDGEIMEP